MLDQLLKSVSVAMKVNVLSTEECYGAARQKLCIDNHSVYNLAIKYLHELNIIFYCPGILPKVVFPDPKAILSMITELVRCNHTLRTNDEDTAGTLPRCMQSGEGARFKKYAQINAKLLEKAFPSHYKMGLFNAADFLKLLEGLLIAGRVEKGDYFIPSLLPGLSKEKISEDYVTSSDHPAPLIIHYPNMWLPVGVFPSLVVYLRNKCELVILEKRGEPQVYYNCIKFRLPSGKGGSIVLINSIKFLEIHIKSRLDHKLCHTIITYIMAGLKEANKSLHYDPPKTEIGFFCSGKCGKTDELHLATLDDEKTELTCSENPEEEGVAVTERELVWLEEPKQGMILYSNFTCKDVRNESLHSYPL